MCKTIDENPNRGAFMKGLKSSMSIPNISRRTDKGLFYGILRKSLGLIKTNGLI